MDGLGLSGGRLKGDAMLEAEEWQLKREAYLRMKERSEDLLLAAALPDPLRFTSPKSRTDFYLNFFDATDSEPRLCILLCPSFGRFVSLPFSLCPGDCSFARLALHIFYGWTGGCQGAH
jgi:hypothetical protein